MAAVLTLAPLAGVVVLTVDVPRPLLLQWQAARVAHPHQAVVSQNDADGGALPELDLQEVLLLALHQEARDADEVTRKELAVLGAPRVEGDSAVRVELLHLAAHGVALRENVPHVELVLPRPPPLGVAGKVHRAQVENPLRPRMLARPTTLQADLPPLTSYLADRPDHHVPDLRLVLLHHRPNRHQPIHPLHRSAYRGPQRRIVLGYSRPVSPEKAALVSHLYGIPDAHEVPVSVHSAR
mmetsp:Transcript_2082/g.6936  ORF Transcript_2082/g.6936 Transcript_2082/m.6936 type:complete len:239 (+) Transcript_2082:310-1026(+)